MEFFNTAFVFLAPMLILLSFILKKNYKNIVINSLAIVNVLLIINSFNVIKTLYSYYQLATIMGIEINLNKFSLGWLEIRGILVVVLPFLFLIKKISAEKLLSTAMFFLLSFDVLTKLINPKAIEVSFSVITFATDHLLLQIINYVSWFAAVYALFGLIGRLPIQNKK